jgi:hypothetical protein
MGSTPLYFQILVIDIERFGTRRNPVQQHIRTQLYRIVGEAMADSGITAEELQVSDRGDGAFWLLPTSVSKVDLTGRFIVALQTRLAAYAQVSSSQAALRLRVALHAGEVGSDEHGWLGEDLNTACRLVDLDALRDTLAAATRSCLVLAVSDSWYSAVVRHDYPGIDRTAFWPIRFHAKEVRQTAWVSVPGYQGPPGIQPDNQGADPAVEAGTAEPRPAGPAASPGPAPATFSGPFAQATIYAREVYGGDHHDHGEGNRGRGA